MKEDELDNISYSVRGFYTTALFTMYVKGKLSPNLSEMTIRDRGTFVHEYIHYLQNITTISGLRYSTFHISFIIEFIKWLKNQCQINIPVDMGSVCSNGRLKNDYAFFNHISGTTKSFDFDIKQDLMWNFDPKVTNQTVHFKVTRSDGIDEYILLGTLGIKESMAALYQSLIDEDSENKHNAYPYRIVPFIVNNLFPDIAHDKKKLICICQIALNSPDPVMTLLEWLVFAHQNPQHNGLYLYEKHLDETYYKYLNKDSLEKIKARDLLIQSSDNFTQKIYKILGNKDNHYVNVLKTSMQFSDIHLRILYHSEDIISQIKLVMQVCGVPFVFNDLGETMHLTRKKDSDSEKYSMDWDISFIISLHNMCASFLLPQNTQICRCLFRTIYCNRYFTPDEIADHTFCIDEPWKEKQCQYWKILNTLELDTKPINIIPKVRQQ